MIKLRTLKQAAEEIRRQDPDTALNENFLRSLVESGQICADRHGNRTLIDMELSAVEIWKLSGVKGCHGGAVFPHFRSIRDAAKIIRAHDNKSAVTEEILREWVADGTVHSITAGSKQLVMTEDFLLPYSAIFRKQYQGKTQKPSPEKHTAPSKSRHGNNSSERRETWKNPLSADGKSVDKGQAGTDWCQPVFIALTWFRVQSEVVILLVHCLFIQQKLFHTDIKNSFFIVPRNDILLHNNNFFE